MDSQGDCARLDYPSCFDRSSIPAVSQCSKSGQGEEQQCFSVVSYNILAECHRLRWDYSYTADEFLSQDYRHGLMMKELAFLDGDIVCLQEVGPEYFTSTLLPAMRRQGYDGLMKCRTKPEYEEGAATFYKTDLFHLKASKEASLGEAALKDIGSLDVSDDVREAVTKYLDRADVVLVTQFVCKASGRSVTVGNVHIWWEDNLCLDVKCSQAACAIKEVVGMAGGEGAHMICGDFNSEWSTPVYQLVLDGYLSDFSIHSLQAVTNLQLTDPTLSRSLVEHCEKALRHPAKNLKSAYSTVLGKEPEMTSYTDVPYMLDYIFYDAASLSPVRVLAVADGEAVVSTGGLPSRGFPSDHLSLKAVLAFTTV